MNYWIIAHDVLPETYLTREWDRPGRRWGKFDDAIRFGSKGGAVVVIDVMFAGCSAIEVADPCPERMTDSPEWYRERMRRHLANQKQHRQGQAA